MSCEKKVRESEDRIVVREVCYTGQEWPDKDAVQITIFKDESVAEYIWEWRAWLGFPAWNGYRWLCEYDPKERDKLLELARSGDLEALDRAIWGDEGERCEEISYWDDP